MTTVTISAADPAGLQANQGFNVEVGQDGGRPATVTIFGLRKVDDRNTSVDPSNVAGDVSVLLDVQYNDETVTNVDLMLGDEVISCRGASSDAATPAGVVPGVAESGGSVEIECFFDTDQVAGECVGMQMEPRFANGDHELSAQITTSDGTTRSALASQMITLKNSNYVMLAHSAGSESAVAGGVTFYGGPAGEDESNVNAFHACPVAFNGTTVGEISLHAMVTGPGGAELADAPPALAFSALSNGTPRNGVARIDKEAPFTWSVNPAINWNVENTAGENEHWLINGGDIKDDGGLLVTDEFRGDEEAKLGPLHFDYKGPTFDTADGERGISLRIGTSNVAVTNTYYSAGNFTVNGLADAGVGGASASFAVGDCSVGANSDGDRRTAFAAIEGLGDVSGIGDLDENDKDNNFGDDSGANCYLAEVAAVYDGLMNARSARSGNSTIQTPSHFGVDRGNPELSDLEPDEAGLVLRAGAMLSFDVEDPELGTGELGSGISRIRWWTGASWARSTGSGGVRGLATVDEGGGTVSISTDHMGARDGRRNVTVEAWDGATPANTARGSFSFTRDTEEPTFTLSKTQGDIDPQSATAVTVSVGGTISDANVIRSAELQLRRVATDRTCATADTLPRREGTNARVSRNRVDLENDTNAITFDETFTINAPKGKGTGPENLCFYLDSEDIAVEPNGRDAGNEGDYVLNEFTVSWRDDPVDPPGPTFDFSTRTANADVTTASALTDTLEVVEGGGTGVVYHVSLTKRAASDTVMVTVAAPPGLSVNIEGGTAAASQTLTFDGTADTVAVTVTADHDGDIDSETLEVNHTAEGYTPKAVSATSMDDDFMISASVTQVRENADAMDVLVTVTAGSATTAERTGSAVAAVIAGGSAATDFTVTGTADITIAAMATTDTFTLSVDATDDTERGELGEMIRLEVSGSADPTATYYMPWDIEIGDDDPDFELSLSQDEVAEGAGQVTVTITATPTGTVDVRARTVFTLATTGSAASGTDYSTNPATIELPVDVGTYGPNDRFTVDVVLTINEDDDTTTNTTIVFDDTDGAGGLTVSENTTLTIVDNDSSSGE